MRGVARNNEENGQWIMNNDRSPAWKMEKVVTINSEFSLCGLICLHTAALRVRITSFGWTLSLAAHVIISIVYWNWMALFRSKISQMISPVVASTSYMFDLYAHKINADDVIQRNVCVYSCVYLGYFPGLTRQSARALPTQGTLATFHVGEYF